jgi:ERCC4-related helicase
LRLLVTPVRLHALTACDHLQAIADFKGGMYNVLVATSIGEEGLDIGSVDKIICYDAQKSSVRMVSSLLLFILPES